MEADWWKQGICSFLKSQMLHRSFSLYLPTEDARLALHGPELHAAVAAAMAAAEANTTS